MQLNALLNIHTTMALVAALATAIGSILVYRRSADEEVAVTFKKLILVAGIGTIIVCLC